MEFDQFFSIYTLITSLITLILGLIIRDLYKWIKSKLIKGGNKPKIYIEFKCRHTSSQGLNPRTYNYESKLSITNIDNESIYNVETIFLLKKWSNCILNKNITKEPFLVHSIKQHDKIELIGIEQINIPDSEDNEPKAKERLPNYFTNPQFKISYENYKGRKFSEIKKY
ncbi:hypothetical protein ACFLSV_01575 [Bacteroidota bacterium]